MSRDEYKVIPTHEAVQMLETWRQQGHKPEAAITVIGVPLVAKGKGVFAGIQDYYTGGALLIPESMDDVYGSYAELYAAIGVLLDDVAILSSGVTNRG
ncbi:hypothetical protein D3C85_1348870 [compost metagenome]